MLFIVLGKIIEKGVSIFHEPIKVPLIPTTVFFTPLS